MHSLYSAVEKQRYGKDEPEVAVSGRSGVLAVYGENVEILTKSRMYESIIRCGRKGRNRENGVCGVK